MIKMWSDKFLQSVVPNDPQVEAKACRHAEVLCAHLKLTSKQLADLFALYFPLACWLDKKISSMDTTLVVGINGAQGSGKSTAAAFLKCILENVFKKSVCSLSIDDIYLPRKDREKLSQEAHPLLRTRGVPGTHDVSLGLRLLEECKAASKEATITVPHFNKATDDRSPVEDSTIQQGTVDCIVFEGWCVGAKPEPEHRLAEPVNKLEKDEDPKGVWRHYVNSQLALYRPLFAQIDILIMLQAPSFEKVYEWRQLQEFKLKQSLGDDAANSIGIMNDEMLYRFVMHYERLTRWMLEEMPDRVDFLLKLDASHKVTNVHINSLSIENSCRK